MPDYESAAALFREVGPMLEPDTIIEIAETRSWGVKLANGLAVTVTYDPDSASLFFEIPLGLIQDDGRSTAQEFLLRMSYLWRETGALHGAIAGDGEAYMIHNRPVQGLDTAKLRILLINLGRCAEAWAIALAKANDSDEAPAADMDPNSPGFVGIRV
ncbi:MAG: type III secretion system chaperone [Pseudomonadota bacterium]